AVRIGWRKTRPVLTLAPRCQRNDVVQHFRPGFKKAPDVAGRLTNALLVFDERDADVAFAVFAKAGAGRYGDSGLLNQKRGEFDAAKSAERFGYWRPSEHRGRRRGYRPARSAEGLDQSIAAAPVCGAHFVDAVVRTVERRG